MDQGEALFVCPITRLIPGVFEDHEQTIKVVEFHQLNCIGPSSLFLLDSLIRRYVNNRIHMEIE